MAVVLGSGGHTTELLLLLSSLDPSRYTPRTYLVPSGDATSATKAHDLERSSWSSRSSALSSINDDDEDAPTFDFFPLPRARHVHQSWLSTPVSTFLSFAACLRLFLQRSHHCHGRPSLADVILMNGPGTCVPLVAAVYVDRVSSRNVQRRRGTHLPHHWHHKHLTDTGPLHAHPHLRRVLRPCTLPVPDRTHPASLC